jgi:hypothetical protein
VSRYWSQERASWCTGQPPLRWSVAGHDASQLVQFGISDGCPTRSRARYPVCDFAACWCRWWRGNHSSDSQPNALTLHLGLPHSWGALFLFKKSK